jgi:hypothetical protein
MIQLNHVSAIKKAWLIEPGLFGLVLRVSFLGGLRLRRAGMTTARPNQSLQLLLLLIAENGAAIFKRFDT